MKKSRLNKIERAVRMWLAFMAMVLPLLSAQAETASELLAAMKGDTITLAYSNDNTNYYLMVGKDNSISATLNNTDTTALWKVYNFYGVGFKLENLSTHRWLRVEGTKQGYDFLMVADISEGTMFCINSVEEEPDYATTGRGFASIYFVGGRQQRFFLY